MPGHIIATIGECVPPTFGATKPGGSLLAGLLLFLQRGPKRVLPVHMHRKYKGLGVLGMRERRKKGGAILRARCWRYSIAESRPNKVLLPAGDIHHVLLPLNPQVAVQLSHSRGSRRLANPFTRTSFTPQTAIFYLQCSTVLVPYYPCAL